MASQYVVDNADMKAVADAIREKGKTSDELVFPDGFVKVVLKSLILKSITTRLKYRGKLSKDT